MDVEKFSTEIADIIAEHVSEAIRPLERRVAELESSLRVTDVEGRFERRIKSLEANRAETLADCYRGAWRTGSTHERGELVTDRGSMWLCLSATNTRPGESDDWQLVVKAGKNARYEFTGSDAR